MSHRTWKIVAVLSCSGMALASVVFIVYIGWLVVTAANLLLGILCSVLIAESLARKVFGFFTWWWPELATPEWIAKHPPLIRLDRFKKSEL